MTATFLPLIEPHVWASTPLLVALAAVLLGTSLVFVPRMERMA